MGKTQVIGNTTVQSQQAGFYCSVCECLLKDSITYLDHINGKWHQRAFGISMRVEKVGADKVRSRINDIQRKREEFKKHEDITEPYKKLFVKTLKKIYNQNQREMKNLIPKK